jgi:hypothetical protein
LPQAIGIIGLIGQQTFDRTSHLKKRDRHFDIGDVARGQGEGDRSAAIIGQTLYFARSSAS